MAKPTLMDVAAAAGVSYATADRVLNRRGGVAEKSVLRVLAAIEQLGYTRDVTAANLARGRSYNYAFLIPAQAGAFFGEMRAAVKAEAKARASQRINITIEEVPAFNSDGLAEVLESCIDRDLSGICLVAINSPRVRKAIQALRSKGVFVLTLVADTQSDSRDAYIGLDNLAAGRTAGRVLSLASRDGGVVLPIAGSLDAADHALRFKGFKQAIAFDVTVLPVIESYDRPENVAEAVRSTLEAHPNLIGIYSIGSGQNGLFTALSEVQKSATYQRPVVVLHDLVGSVRTALTIGLVDAVIDQKPDQQIARALDAMKALSDGETLPADFGTIVPSLYFQDNMPPAPADGPEKGPSL